MAYLPIPLKKILITIVLLFSFNELAFAQSSEDWSAVKRIPELSDIAMTPYLVADQNRTVHSFVSDQVGDDSNPQLAIFYNKWSRQSGWSEPIDIILPAKGEARVKGAYLDQKGTIHLIFFEGGDTGGTINYSSAPAVDAGNAYSWSDPVEIGTATITPDEAAVAGDNQGNLYVVYAGKQYSHGLYFIHSDNGGLTWTEPSEIFLTYRWDLWPSRLQLYLDNSEDLHVVWALGNITGNSIAVYHRRLDTDQMVWADTVELAKATSGEVDTPSIIEYDDGLFVIYHDGNPTTRYMRRSSDSGQSWTDPVRLFPHVGSNGAASLAVDGNNDLHMFFGNRTETNIQGMWHSVWVENRWSEPAAVISGPRIVDKFGDTGFDPSFARAVISQGNVVLLTWETDPGAGQNGAWYSSLLLDIPEMPIAEFPQTTIELTVEQLGTQSDNPPAQITSVPTSSIMIEEISPPPEVNSFTRSMLIGISATFLLIISILAYSLIRRRFFIY